MMVDSNGKLDTFAHLKKGAFLAAFVTCGTVSQAADLAGISRSSHYNWLNDRSVDGDKYRAAFLEAERDFKDRLQEEAYRRAIEGTRKLVTYKGRPVFIGQTLAATWYRKVIRWQSTANHSMSMHTRTNC